MSVLDQNNKIKFNFTYNRALVCKSVPNSITNGLTMHPEQDKVNLDKASRQHERYVHFLKESGIKVIEVEADEAYPDCVFVEDTAIIIGNKICITNPGAQSRRGEVINVRKAFEKYISETNENFQIYAIGESNDAFVDGGDCLFTGRELFVGLSNRTNRKGFMELSKIFEEIPVIPIQLSETLHLKCLLTMGAPDTIIIGKSENAQDVRNQIKGKSKYIEYYKFVEVPDDDRGSANVLFLNNRLAYMSQFDYIYENNLNLKQVERIKIEADEFQKVDGALTCRSVLFNSMKQIS